MKFLPLMFALLGFAAQLGAAPVPLKYQRIDLADGRILMNVVVKSYDAVTGKLLVLADGKAVLFPIKLLPQPFREKLKTAAPPAGSTNSVVPGQKAPASVAAPSGKPAPETASPPTKK
jgi:hypothetical protein